jgi:uroporphyrinogen-III synthase
MERPEQSLAGLKVLITRPKELANNLAHLVEKAGGAPVLYPVISIEEPENTEQYCKALDTLSSVDIAIFISPTAVRKTFEHINHLPATIKVTAIGSSTEKSLNDNNVLISFQSDGHNSESLLKCPELQSGNISAKKILIFRGEGGRERLANTLKERGALVDYAEMYRRVRTKNASPLTADQISKLDIITVTSNEGLQNLFDLAENRQALLKLPLLVPGERCEILAKQLGFHNVIKSKDARDASCIEALHSWATILCRNT